MSLLITGLILAVFKLIRPKFVRLNEHNLEEFLKATNVFGDLQFKNLYPKPEVKIVSPLVMYKTF